MVTHQSLSGSTDEEFMQRMARTYPERFDEAFWAFFTGHVAPHLPPRPVILDLGCGPGLFLCDLAARYPQATLYGYDVTPAMIAYGQQLPSTGVKPTLVLHDTATQLITARRWYGASGKYVIGPAHLRRALVRARRDSAGSGARWSVSAQRLDPSTSAGLSDAAYGEHAGRAGWQLTGRLSSLSGA